MPLGVRLAQLAEALRYKPEVSGFDSRLHNPSDRTVALVSTQPVTEMSTRNISWGVKAAGAYGRQPCHLHLQIVLNFRETQTPGAQRYLSKPETA